MIVHLLAPSIYSRDYYTFLNNNFNSNEHVIFSYVKIGSEEFKKNFYDEKAQTDSFIPVHSPLSFKFLRQVYTCDGIIIHGLFNIWYTAFLVLNPLLLKKCNWVVWGGDIYTHLSEKKSLKEKVRERLKICIGKNIGYVTTLTIKDYDLFKEWYGFKGHKFLTKYPTPLTRVGVLDALCEKKNERNKGIKFPVNIVIGNSATETNQHFEALDLLKKYKGEDIKIYIPLSYGLITNYLEYRKKVVEYAVDLFGEEKIVPIYNKMDGTDYSKLLSTMDIGIFNCNRQQAMGNIAILMASGAKVFLRKDTTMWSTYVDRNNVVNDIYSISDSSFDEFIFQTVNDRECNYQIIYENTSVEINTKRWGNIFEGLSGRKRYE